jgi:hypothetical protein
MKQTVIVIGLAVIIVIISITIMSVQSRSNRQNELERVVAAAAKQTVADTQVFEQDIIKSDKEMIAAFVQNVCTSIKGDGDLSVKVFDVDYKEGMIDVMVTEKFTYLNGKQSQVSTRKCAIYQ